MATPQFDEHGLLPPGVHVCSMEEIVERLAWNDHRRELFDGLDRFLAREIRPIFRHPIDVGGSFATDKERPADVDVVLDLRRATEEQQSLGLRLLLARAMYRETYGVDFWINLPGEHDFSEFFQYAGIKTATAKGLAPRHRKGILRVR